MRRAWVGFCFATVGVSPPAAADIYQYVDSDGTVHFTNSKAGAGAKLYLKTARVASQAAERDPSRYTRYDDTVRQAAALYQIPEALIRAVIRVESDFDPRAVSSAGARGLMQLMPETAGRMQVRDSADPRENILGGVRYLRILANMFSGDLELTLAAYNAGEQAVVQHAGIPPYAETRDYVVRVMRYYRRYRSIPDATTASLSTD